MAVPFSNTRLRVPRGFAALLEGLAREVLRDQPEDIPAYAALHFDGLLKEREESGLDHAEWAAKLEDRFYNNHAFKAGPTSPKVSAVKEPATEKTTTSEEMSSGCQTEDDASYPSTSKPSTSEHAQTSDDKENDNVTEKDIVSTEMDHSQVESDNRTTDTDVTADEMTVSEVEKVQTISVSDQVDRMADAGDDEKHHMESSLFSSSADVAVEERGTTDDEQGQNKDIFVKSEEMGDSVKDNQTSEVESTEEEVSYSALADIDVCAAELVMPEDKREEIFEKNETHVDSQEMRSSMEKSADESADEEVLRRAQELLGEAEKTLSGNVDIDDPSNVHSSEQETSAEKMDEISGHSLPSQTEPLETSLHEAVDVTEEHLVEEDAKPGSAETQEVSSIDADPFQGVPEAGTEDEPKEEAFVEISFDDVPEIQDKQTDDEPLDMLKRRPSEELVETGAHDTQDQKEATTEMDTAEMELAAEAGQTTDQCVDTALEKHDQSDSDSDHSEKKADLTDIIPSCQVTSETKEDHKVVDDTTDSPAGDNDKADEIKDHFKMEESKQATQDPQIIDPNETNEGEEGTRDTSTPSGSESAEKFIKEVDDDSTKLNSLQTAPSDHSEREGAKENETVEANNMETIPADSEERLQPLDRADKTDERAHEQQVSEGQENVAGETVDSEDRGKVDAVVEEEEEGRVIPSQTAEQADDDSPDNHRPAGSDKGTVGVDSQCISDDKDECSRPQEEEDIMDIPLDDPEANKAAAKIQAGFRGHMTRKKIKPDNKAEVEERQEDRGQ